jgi:hypothetical protein
MDQFIIEVLINTKKIIYAFELNYGVFVLGGIVTLFTGLILLLLKKKFMHKLIYFIRKINLFMTFIANCIISFLLSHIIYQLFFAGLLFWVDEIKNIILLKQFLIGSYFCTLMDLLLLYTLGKSLTFKRLFYEILIGVCAFIALSHNSFSVLSILFVHYIVQVVKFMYGYFSKGNVNVIYYRLKPLLLLIIACANIYISLLYYNIDMNLIIDYLKQYTLKQHSQCATMIFFVGYLLMEFIRLIFY